MRRFSKVILVFLSLTVFFIYSQHIAGVSAHNGIVHRTKKVFVCNGKEVTWFKFILTKYFSSNKVPNICYGYNKILNPDPEPSILPSLQPSPIALPTQTPILKIHSTTIPSPKPTASPVSQISTKTSTISSPATNGAQPSQYWHAPGAHDGLNVHEHGDKPPAWADEFSQKNFGHPVMFGGDEATPNENILKHQAYKGFLMNASGVDVFIRYHSMSAPHDRSGVFHSYEVYAKDGSGNVSFWQGWIFYGYPSIPSQRMPRHGEQPGFDPIYNITWPGRTQFIISGSDEADWKDYKRCEQWYGHAGVWSWDLSITICGATTYFTPGEYLTDVYNQSTWHLTGDKGGSRRLEISHYGPENPLVGGVNLPFDKWFCVKKLPNENKMSGATPTWDVSGAVSGPNACQEGWLPQFIAGTFPKKGVYFQTGNTAEKDFPTTGVTVPN